MIDVMSLDERPFVNDLFAVLPMGPDRTNPRASLNDLKAIDAVANFTFTSAAGIQKCHCTGLRLWAFTGSTAIRGPPATENLIKDGKVTLQHDDKLHFTRISLTWKKKKAPTTLDVASRYFRFCSQRNDTEILTDLDFQDRRQAA